MPAPALNYLKINTSNGNDVYRMRFATDENVTSNVSNKSLYYKIDFGDGSF